MTLFKQIEANRANARKSTGPRTEGGKQRSRSNALRHGLTAETVITALESAAEYQAFEASIASDYQPCSVTERELVLRLASLLWRLRRSTSFETGLFQIEGELMCEQRADVGWRRVPPPEWYDELDTKVLTVASPSIGASDRDQTSSRDLDSTKELASCFIRAVRLGRGAFDLLNRYEAVLWRLSSQILFMLQSARR